MTVHVRFYLPINLYFFILLNYFQSSAMIKTDWCSVRQSKFIDIAVKFIYSVMLLCCYVYHKLIVGFNNNTCTLF